MLIRIWRRISVVSLIAGQALAMEIPLIVEETAGIERIGNAVNSGVPLPIGAVKDVAELRLLDSQGNAVLASIEPRARWLKDKSLKWVTIHFLSDLPANGRQTYTLATSGIPLPMSELAILQEDKVITVVTGPAKFVIPTDRFAPFDQVYLRANTAEAFGEGDALLAKPATVILVARNGESRVVPRTGEHKDEFRTELVRIDEETFAQTAAIQTATIEEQGPGRVVVALKGTFSTPAEKSLDFTARLYFYSGSPEAEITFSVQNRQIDSMARFVAIDRLAVELQLKTASQSTVSLSIDNKTMEKPMADGDVRLAQIQWNVCQLNMAPAGETYDGWIRLASEAGTLTAGTRWSWQVYPMGAAARSDGSVALDLKSAEGERIDLYTAGFLLTGGPNPGRTSSTAVSTISSGCMVCSLKPTINTSVSQATRKPRVIA